MVVTHGGGASSVSQTNDTDLHLHLRRKYCELEMADAAEQMRLMPTGVPCARTSDVIGWAACIWSLEELHAAACRGFLKVGLTNALDGAQDAEICREAAQFWCQEGMRQIRSNVVNDVNVEADAGRLTWNYQDVYAVVNPFPVRGKRYDEEPMDKGSDEESEGDTDSSQDDDADHIEDNEGVACAPAVAGHDAHQIKDGSASPSEQGLGHSTVVAVSSSLTPGDGALLQACQSNLQSMRVVLQQVQALGHLSLEAQVQKAMHLEEKKIRIVARENSEIAHAFQAERDAERFKARVEQLSIRRAFAQDKQRRITIRELQEHQERLRLRRLELLRASTVVECQRALKSWEVQDLGQGNAEGGSRAHVKNRMAILERLRCRAKPLPPDLENDWHWFIRQWDIARVRRMRDLHKLGWGAQFRDIVRDLLDKMKTDSDALSSWMRRERQLYLRAPALRL